MATREEAIAVMPEPLQAHVNGLRRLNDVELANECLKWARTGSPEDRCVGIATRMVGIFNSGALPDVEGMFAWAQPKKAENPVEQRGKLHPSTIKKVTTGYQYDRLMAESEMLQEFRSSMDPSDLTKFYKALFDEAVSERNDRAMRIYAEYMMGKPVEVSQTQHVDVAAMIDRMLEIGDSTGGTDYDISADVEIYADYIEVDGADSAS